MAEEIQEGQPAQAPPSLGMVPDIPVVPKAPAETQPPQPADGGRSVEELFKEMEEIKRLNAELADRAARAEHEASYTRNLVETFRQTQVKPAEPVPDIPQVTDDEFLTNPAKATSKVIEGYFARDRAERDKREREQYVERAKSMFETGKRQAADKVGKLLSGVENDVAQQIQQGIIAGTISPDAATDPDLWAATAMVYRYKIKGERNFDKYFNATHTPMAPTHQETPTAASPPKAEMTLSAEQEEIISRAGITREQFLQAWAKERSITEGRAK